MPDISQWLRGFLNGDAARDERMDADDETIVDAPSLRAVVASDPRPACAVDVFEVGWRTDTGLVRSHNEDGVYVFTGCLDAEAAPSAFGLFMVADGMGGHAGGEDASALALRTAAGKLIDTVYVPLLSGVERGAEQPAIGDLVRQAGEAANAAVGRALPGSGCTLTYGLVVGTRLFVGHVGDSRAYLLRDTDAPKVLTQDHSFVRRLVEVGQLTEAEALEHPQRNVLYRAIGQPETLDVDVLTLPLEPGDQLLLCSDGLWNMVTDAEIQEIVSSIGDVQAVCDRFVVAANAAGGEDNITAVLVRVNIE